MPVPRVPDVALHLMVMVRAIDAAAVGANVALHGTFPPTRSFGIHCVHRKWTLNNNTEWHKSQVLDNKKAAFWVVFVVPGLGFEPRLPGPEPGVLPLDDPGASEWRNEFSFIFSSRQFYFIVFHCLLCLPLSSTSKPSNTSSLPNQSKILLAKQVLQIQIQKSSNLSAQNN